MGRILTCVFAILWLVTLIIAVILNWQKKDLEIELINCKSTLTIQNEAIKKNELDLETFKNTKPVIEERIATKYQKIVLKDETCEREKESIKALISAFFEEV